MTSEKSKSKRIVSKKVPGGRTVKHRENKTPSKAKCGRCGAELHGIPKNTRKSFKSQRTVNRPYGGHYCSRCTRAKIIEENS